MGIVADRKVEEVPNQENMETSFITQPKKQESKNFKKIIQKDEVLTKEEQKLENDTSKTDSLEKKITKKVIKLKNSKNDKKWNIDLLIAELFSKKEKNTKQTIDLAISEFEYFNFLKYMKLSFNTENVSKDLLYFEETRLEIKKNEQLFTDSSSNSFLFIYDYNVSNKSCYKDGTSTSSIEILSKRQGISCRLTRTMLIDPLLLEIESESLDQNENSQRNQNLLFDMKINSLSSEPEIESIISRFVDNAETTDKKEREGFHNN